jgi:tetratricopeptide (TPR) repeat protein
LARTLMVSTLARDQSSPPCSPRRSNTSRCSRSNRSALAHSVRRRQQVDGEPQPSSRAGSSRQDVEVRAMKTIAAKQLRSAPAATARRSPTAHLARGRQPRSPWTGARHTQPKGAKCRLRRLASSVQDQFHYQQVIGALRRYSLVRTDPRRPDAERASPHWPGPATEARLGPDHLDTARALNTLGLVLRAQGALAEARSVHERALGIREDQLGHDHPDTASSLSNLALVLRNQGDRDGARSLHERALRIREEQLGPTTERPCAVAIAFWKWTRSSTSVRRHLYLGSAWIHQNAYFAPDGRQRPGNAGPHSGERILTRTEAFPCAVSRQAGSRRRVAPASVPASKGDALASTRAT